MFSSLWLIVEMLSLSSIGASIIGIFLYLPSSLAHPGRPNSSELKTCHEYKIDVNVESEIFIWTREKFRNSYNVVNLIIDLTSRETDAAHPLTSHAKGTTSGVIAATFCTPVNANAAKRDIILLATHGLNYDRRCARLLACTSEGH